MRYVVLLISYVLGYGASVETLELAKQFVYLEEAAGQSDSEVRYWVRGSSSHWHLTGNKIFARRGLGSDFASLEFGVGSPVSVGSERVEYRVHRFMGEQGGWRRDIAGYRMVEYAEVRPGVDLVFRPVATDLIRLGMVARVRAGLEPDAFTLQGQGEIQFRANGSAILVSSFHSYGLAAPKAWQVIDGKRVERLARFVGEGSAPLRIEVDGYDRSEPVYLETSLEEPLLNTKRDLNLEKDPQSRLFVAATVESVVQCGLTSGGRVVPCTDVWVIGLGPNGEPLFSTTLEGAYEESVNDIQWKAPGELVVIGNTTSMDFPVSADALQKENAGPVGPIPKFAMGTWGDLFLARLDAGSGELRYSTLLGGPEQGETGLLTIAGEKVVVLMSGAGADFRVSATGWIRAPICGEGIGCVISSLLRFNSTLTKLERSTFLPLVNFRSMEGYRDGSIYLAGTANDAGPKSAMGTAGAYSVMRQGDSDAYLLRLNADLSAPVFATMYGGPGPETGQQVLVGKDGQATLLGEGFVAEFSADGSRLLSSRKLGRFTRATQDDQGRLILGVNESDLLCRNAGYVATRITGPDLDLIWDGDLLGRDTIQWVATNRVIVLTGFDDGFRLRFIDLNGAMEPVLRCVTGAASLVLGEGISPGRIVTIAGSGIGPEVGMTGQLAGDGKFPLALGGVTVRVNGERAPLLYAQASQVNAVVPYEKVLPFGQARVEVEYQGRIVGLTLPTSEGAVELFTLDSVRDGPAVALNQDGSLNTEQNPAAPGSIVVLFGTGIGVTEPRLVTGGIAPAAPLARVAGPVSALMNGREVEVAYAGAAPGLVNGLAQFNLRVPEGVSGAVSVAIQVHGLWPVNRPTVWVR